MRKVKVVFALVAILAAETLTRSISDPDDCAGEDMTSDTGNTGEDQGSHGGGEQTPKDPTSGSTQDGGHTGRDRGSSGSENGKGDTTNTVYKYQSSASSQATVNENNFSADDNDVNGSMVINNVQVIQN